MYTSNVLFNEFHKDVYLNMLFVANRYQDSVRYNHPRKFLPAPSWSGDKTFLVFFTTIPVETKLCWYFSPLTSLPVQELNTNGVALARTLHKTSFIQLEVFEMDPCCFLYQRFFIFAPELWEYSMAVYPFAC